jgi:hypothetical protein
LKSVSNTENNYSEGVVIRKNDFITKDIFMINTFGVFKTPTDDNHNIIDFKSKQVKPFYFKMTIPDEVKDGLKKLGVKGYFFVRQKRIPTIFGQGVAFGVDKTSFAPMLYSGNGKYLIEGFLVKGDGGSGVDDKEYANRPMLKQDSDYISSVIISNSSQSSCLISLDADISPSLQSYLNGTNFVIQGFKQGNISGSNRSYKHSHIGDLNVLYEPRAVYVSEGTPYKFVEDFGFSTKFGSAEEVKGISFVGKSITNTVLDEGIPEEGQKTLPDSKV